jgi:hypothetical protein
MTQVLPRRSSSASCYLLAVACNRALRQWSLLRVRPKIAESVSRPDPMDSLYYRPSEHFLQTLLIILQVR